MGVKDLYQWAKSNHKSLIVQCRRRFNDPLIRGKKIAIDATLLTNAFHMRRVTGDEAGKQALIGWYTMIREMRAAGVQPIAVWDQKGTREWKAAEARRRLSIRALALARRNHEDERKERLGELRGVMTEFQQKPEREQDALRAYWLEQEWSRYGPPTTDSLSKTEAPESPRSSPSVPSPGTSTPAPPASSATPTSEEHRPFLDRVADILDRHRQSDRPATGRGAPIQGAFDDAVQHVRELEVVSGESAEAGSFDETIPESGQPGETPSNMIDEKLQELLPPDQWVETPRQMDLTAMEGKIIESLLGVPPRFVEVQEPTEAQAEPTPEAVRPATVPVEMAIADLDDLMNRLHEVRHTYARQLALPSSSDHQDCRELLVKLGVPVVTAMIPYEAEGLASALAREGIVDFVGTEDSDVLAYEGPLLRHIGSSSTALAYLSGEQVRAASGLTSAQFLDFCVLLGTDASPRIPKVGPITAMKLIQQYGSIESMLENEPKIAARIPEGYMDMVASARAVFAQLPPLPDGLSMEQGTWNENDVAVWLATEHGIRFAEEAGVLSVEAVGVVTLPTGPGRWVIERWDDETQPPDWGSLAQEVLQELEGEGVEAAGQSDVESVVDELEEVDLEDDGSAVGAVNSDDWEEVVEAELRRGR